MRGWGGGGKNRGKERKRRGKGGEKREKKGNIAKVVI